MSDLLTAVEMSAAKVQGELDELIITYTSCLEDCAALEAGVTAKRADLAKIKGAIASLKGETPPVIEVIDPAVLREQGLLLESEPAPKVKKPVNDGPYANIECKGCGEVGKLRDSMQMMNGRTLRMIVCNACSSQYPT